MGGERGDFVQHGSDAWKLADNVALVTTNNVKAEEISRILGRNLQTLRLRIPEVQSVDFRTVAEAKAVAAYERTGRPVLVDDSGLIIEAWQGLPGAFTETFLSRVGAAGLLQMLDGFPDRSARIVSVLIYFDGLLTREFSGEVHGEIASQIAPGGHYGYDGIFVTGRSDGRTPSARALAVERLLASTNGVQTTDQEGSR